MNNNITVINDMLKIIIREILQGVREVVKNKNFPIAIKEKLINPSYMTFELYAYFIFRIDYLVVNYQEPQVRYPIFDYLASSALDLLNLDRDLFNNVLNNRMQEYTNIQNNNELDFNAKQKQIVDEFIDNLGYSILNNQLQTSTGDEKPIFVLGAVKRFAFAVMQREIVLPTESVFIKTLTKIFKFNSDFRKIKEEELSIILQEE